MQLLLTKRSQDSSLWGGGDGGGENDETREFAIIVPAANGAFSKGSKFALPFLPLSEIAY